MPPGDQIYVSAAYAANVTRILSAYWGYILQNLLSCKRKMQINLIAVLYGEEKMKRGLSLLIFRIMIKTRILASITIFHNTNFMTAWINFLQGRVNLIHISRFFFFNFFLIGVSCHPLHDISKTDYFYRVALRKVILQA